MADRIPCRLFLIRLESAGASSSSNKVGAVLNLRPQQEEEEEEVEADGSPISPAPSMLCYLVPTRPPPSVSPGSTSCRQPFCGHADVCVCETGPCLFFKAACLSFRKLKLPNTCCMNYITSLHMHSVLPEHTHTHTRRSDTNGD